MRAASSSSVGVAIGPSETTRRSMGLPAHSVGPGESAPHPTCCAHTSCAKVVVQNVQDHPFMVKMKGCQRDEITSAVA